MPKQYARSSNPRARPAKKGQNKNRLRGRGDYTTDISNDQDFNSRLEKKIDHLERSLVHATPSIPRALSSAGRSIGNLVGQGDLGSLAGSGLSKIFGFGDYSVPVKGNSLMANATGPSVPKFQGNGKRGVRLTEREFIGNITAGSLSGSSTLFDNHTYPINPESPLTFPWLSQIAKLFDQWDPHGIVFEFHTTSSTFNGSSQALGAVIMATDYDANDAPYSSKQAMENADYACSSVPSCSLLHGVECAPSERPLEIMYTTPRSNPLFSTLGNFQIATQGCSVAGVVLGELWISYDITFYKKQLTPPAPIQYESKSNAVAVGAPMFNPDVNFGSNVNNGPFTWALNSPTSSQITFPPNALGLYHVTVSSTNYQTGDQVAPFAFGGAVIVSSFSTNNLVGGLVVYQAIVSIVGPFEGLTFGVKAVQAGTYRLSIVPVDPSYSFVT